MVIFFLSATSLHAQTKRALLVGISDYESFKVKQNQEVWTNIHGVNDIDLLYSILKNQHYIIKKLTNKDATAKKIRKELKNLISSCKAGDLVYLHFSCHGQPYEDMDGDEEDGWDESLVPYDANKSYIKGVYEGENHILDDELYTYFQRIRESIGKEGFLCVIIDACHSGNEFRGEEDEEALFVRGTKKGFSPQGKIFSPRINTNSNFRIPQDNDLADIVLLEACRSYQSNYEINQSGDYYGPLSYYVSQVLSRQQLTRNLDWVLEVKQLMSSDNRLTRQNMVYETSIK